MSGAPCAPCECPSATKNFAQTCSRDRDGEFVCNCVEGYTGPRCERCARGYWGDPAQEQGECLPCACNQFGSSSDQVSCH